MNDDGVKKFANFFFSNVCRIVVIVVVAFAKCLYKAVVIFLLGRVRRSSCCFVYFILGVV